MKKLIALTTGLVAGTALAAISNNVGVSTQKVESSAWQKFQEKSSISYFGEFNDPSMNNKEAVNQSLYYQVLSGRYQLNDTWTARADIRFETNEGVEDKYTEKNTRIGIQGVPYANGNFSVFTLFRIEGATTDAARDAEQIAKPKLYNAVNYSMGATSLSAGLELAKWFYNQGEEVGGMNNFMDFTIRYTFNDDVTFQSYTELGLDSRDGKENGDVTNTWERHLIGLDLAVAKNIGNVVKNVTIFPHLDYRPHNAEDTSIDDVGIGAWVSATFFQ